jgi:hypothetical protein
LNFTQYVKLVDRYTVDTNVQQAASVAGLDYRVIYYRPEILGKLGFHLLMETPRPTGENQDNEDNLVAVYTLSGGLIVQSWETGNI